MSVTIFTLSSEATPLLIAVVIIPVPIGFVKKSLSPSLISLFLNILSFITPVTVSYTHLTLPTIYSV